MAFARHSCIVVGVWVELEDFVLFLLAVFALLAFNDLFFAVMCRGLGHVGLGPRAFLWSCPLDGRA